MSTSSISILQQRRIEANIIKPLVAAFEKELGREKTREVLAQAIMELARQKGAELRQGVSDDSLESFAAVLEPWQRDDSMDMEVLGLNDDVFRFNVTRCRYAEMYRELGLAELGYTLSCNRDASLIKGFSPDIELSRTQTLMEGASYCDFLYNRKKG
ncbi:MAG: hypothetical protein B6243_09175 [Anaerolineaceae bacterium 4572_5.2]|nr:MAG: hypothetical protein B6243_09175 [Anaerolineaceae bacterium 4572_5.2]